MRTCVGGLGRAEWAVAAIGVAVSCGGASGQLDPFGADEHEPRVRLGMIADHATIAGGQRFMLGVTFEIDPGWHIYWDGKNDTGFAPGFVITAPEGFEVGEAMWPAPHRHVSPGDILDHVYEDRVTLVVPVTAPAGLEPGGEAEFAVVSDWLVCESVCIPEEGEATLTVRAGEARASDKATLKLFEEARARIPKPAPASVWSSGGGGEPFRVIGSKGAKPLLLILAPDAERVRFFPGADSAPIKDLIEGGDRAGGQLVLALERAEDYGRVSGVVEIVGGGGSAFYTLTARDGEPDADAGESRE